MTINSLSAAGPAPAVNPLKLQDRAGITFEPIHS